MSARNWVNKLRGLLQKEDETSPPSANEVVADPHAEGSTNAAAPAAPTSPQAPASVAPPNPATIPNPAPMPPQPRRELKSQRLMMGTPKEQVDWSLHQIAGVGDQILLSLKAQGLNLAPTLERDKTLLKTGYAVVTLALRTKPTLPSIETQRSLRNALKGALLSAMRKEHHKHAIDENALGASMVNQVELELSAIEATVTEAAHQLRQGTPTPCASFLQHLSPLIKESPAAADALGSELEKLFSKVNQALPVQDLLL